MNISYFSDIFPLNVKKKKIVFLTIILYAIVVIQGLKKPFSEYNVHRYLNYITSLLLVTITINSTP